MFVLGSVLEWVFGVHSYSPFTIPVDFLRKLCHLLSPFLPGLVKLRILLPSEEWQQVKPDILWSQRNRLCWSGVCFGGRSKAGKVFGLFSDEAVALLMILKGGKKGERR